MPFSSTQRQTFIARIAAMEAAGEEVDPYLLSERDRYVREEAQAKTFAAPPGVRMPKDTRGLLPTADIDKVVPGLPQGERDQSMLGGYKRAAKAIGTGLATGAVTGTQALLDAARGDTGIAPVDYVLNTAQPVLPLVRQAYKRLMPEITESATEAWEGVRAKANSWSDDANAEAPEMAPLNFAAQVAAPSALPGGHAVASSRAVPKAFVPLGSTVAAKSAEDIIRSVEGKTAASKEYAAQRIHEMQAAIDRASHGVTAGPSAEQLDAAAKAAIGGDSAAFEAMVKADPARYGEVATQVAEVRTMAANLQDLEASVRGRGQEHFSAEGLRLPTVVSARTQRSFGVLRDQDSDAAHAARAFLDKTGSLPGKQALEDKIKTSQASFIPSAQEFHTATDGLRAVSTQRAAKDLLQELSAKARNTEAQAGGFDNVRTDEQLHAGAQLAEIEAVLRKVGFKDPEDARRQLADPTSELYKDRRLTETLVEKMPAWFHQKLGDHEAQVVLDALGESKGASVNAMAGVKTFLTSIREAAIQNDVAKNLAGAGVYDEVPENLAGTLRKVEENWGPLTGRHVDPELYKILKNEFTGQAQTRMAKVAGVLGATLRMRPINAVLNVVDLALNPVYQVKNAIGGQLLAIANGPLGYFASKANAEAIAVTGQVLRRKLATETLPGVGRKIDARVGLTDRQLKHIPTFKSANDFEIGFRQYVRDADLGTDLSREAGMLGLPTASRELGTAGKAMHAATVLPRLASRVGNEGITLADEVGRRQRFALELVNQKRIHGTPTTPEAIEALRKRAGETTENTYQNGAMMPRWLQQLRRETHLLGRAGYVLDAPRFMTGIVRQGLKEIADGAAGRVANPKASIAIGVERLSGFLAVASAASVALAMKNGLGSSRKENAGARAAGPKSPGDAVLIGQDEKGWETNVNLSQIAPMEPVVSLARAIKRAKEDGPEGLEIEIAAHDVANQLGEMFFRLLPGTELAYQVIDNADKYGRPIWTEADNKLEAALKIGGHVAERFSPAFTRGPSGKVSEKTLMGLGRATNVEKQVELGAKDALRSARNLYYGNKGEAAWKTERALIRRMIDDYQARGLSKEQVYMAFAKEAKFKTDKMLFSLLWNEGYQPLPQYVKRDD